jgi:Co/Zn/Cd efflux system component
MAPRTDCSHLQAENLTIRPPIERLWIVLLLTGGFMVVEAVGGWLSGSLALLADAGHMLTDVGALGLSLFTARMARRPPYDTKTYGYLRLEILAALVNGAVLFVIAGVIVIEAVHRVKNPASIQGGLFLLVALLGLLVNAVGLSLLHRHREHHLNTRGAYLHILGDLLGSVGALVAALIVLTTGWTLADPIISVLIAVLILAEPAPDPREHRHPPRGRSGSRLHGRSPTADAGDPRRLRSPRPARVDGDQRDGSHERARRGTSTRRSPRRPGSNPGGDAGSEDWACDHTARGGGEMWRGRRAGRRKGGK